MYTYVLIIFLATSSSSQSGAAGIVQEFGTEQTCRLAGNSISQDATRRGGFVLSWGCFEK